MGTVGPRVYLGGQRLHHGLVGCMLLAVGAALVAHDWRDRPWSLKD